MLGRRGTPLYSAIRSGAKVRAEPCAVEGFERIADAEAATRSRKFTGSAGSVIDHLRELKIANLSDLLVQDEDDDWEVATSDSVGYLLGEARKEEQTKPTLRFKQRGGAPTPTNA